MEELRDIWVERQDLLRDDAVRLPVPDFDEFIECTNTLDLGDEVILSTAYVYGPYAIVQEADTMDDNLWFVKIRDEFDNEYTLTATDGYGTIIWCFEGADGAYDALAEFVEMPDSYHEAYAPESFATGLTPMPESLEEFELGWYRWDRDFVNYVLYPAYVRSCYTIEYNPERECWEGYFWHMDENLPDRVSLTFPTVHATPQDALEEMGVNVHKWAKEFATE